MQKFVFLDIDDVVVPWDYPNVQALIDYSGFANWYKIKHPYIRNFSYDVMRALNEKLQPYIYWLTTWELHGEGANALFCDRLKLPRYQEIPFISNYYRDLGIEPGRIWWKSTILKKFVQGTEGDYRIVWIDNEIDDQTYNKKIDQELLDDPNILRISPYPILRRDQIEEAEAWLA